MAEAKYAKVNGVDLFYETHGTGKPLILLHGGLGVTGMFSQLLPALSNNRQVIAIDLQGHGRTRDIDRPFSFENMADDVAALIAQLGLDAADLLGYSLGGGVALQTAIRHPERVNKLILISAPFASEGWFPESRAGMRAMNEQAAQAMLGSPPHQAYVQVAPNPENWTRLVTKTGQLLRNDYDWSGGVAQLKMPVMLVVADADAIQPAHTVRFFELLGGGLRDAGWDGSGKPNSRLAVLPGTTHYDILFSPFLPSVITSFLNAELPMR